VTRKSGDELENVFPEGLPASTPLITLPKIDMTRIGLVKMAVVLGISNQLIELGDKIVFIAGHPELGTLDAILYLDTAKESEILATQGLSDIAESVNPEVFQVALSIALELASKGREGKPVGTIFVIGDEEKVLQLSKQMIINPFKGYSDEERNILNPNLKETLREFSALDGAFVISRDGLVLTAGRYLGAASDEATIPRGLGSRHIAAAGITAMTQAAAIVISESTGDVRIFKNGKILMEIEKPIKVPQHK
jgi:DNA integrity scanning protein DisA with diadenylate cyclase activity